MKRTPLRSYTPLARHTPLRATTGLSRKPQSVPAGSVSPRKTPRDTGPDARTRALVLARDGYQCARCGKAAGPGIAPYSIQHRKARGVGGDNSPCNLLLLCGSATTLCHGEVEARESAHDQAAGWRLESWQDPASEGVLYVSEHGSGVLMYLDDEGGISPDTPAGWNQALARVRDENGSAAGGPA